MSVRWKIAGALTLFSLLAVAVSLRSSWTSSETAFLRGLEALDHGDWRTVSQQIEFLRQRPRDADRLRILRGGLLLRTGDYTSATRELSRVQPTSTFREQAALLICEALYFSKRWSDAEALALEVLSKNPDQVDAHRWLGAIYYDLGAMQEAENHLTRLAQLAPLDYSPLRMLGLIHKDFERYKEAITDYQKALVRHPPESVRV